MKGAGVVMKGRATPPLAPEPGFLAAHREVSHREDTFTEQLREDRIIEQRQAPPQGLPLPLSLG